MAWAQQAGYSTSQVEVTASVAEWDVVRRALEKLEAAYDALYLVEEWSLYEEAALATIKDFIELLDFTL